MTNLPFSIDHRPFALEHSTNLMLPDGIFDLGLTRMNIGFIVRNNLDIPLKFLWFRPDTRHENQPEWKYAGPQFIKLKDVPPGASKIVIWEADFTECTIGKKALPIEFGAQPDWGGGGFDGYLEKTIFVSKTSWNPQTKLYTCQVPEGKLDISFSHSSHIPGWKYEKYINGDHVGEVEMPALAVPDHFDGTMVSNPGNEDEIPFNDPWWKVVALIVAIIASIAAYKSVHDGIGIGVTFDTDPEDPSNSSDNIWCRPTNQNKMSQKNNEAVALAMLASMSWLVVASHKKDPWERGREKHPFNPENPRISESVVCDFDPPERLEAGAEWIVPGKWTYRATLRSGEVLEHTVKEEQTSEVFLSERRTTVPKNVVLGEKIVVEVFLRDPSGSPMLGNSIFAYAIFNSPSKIRSRQVFFEDTHAETGERLPPGTFHASIDTSEPVGDDPIGVWSIRLFAQKVNTATPEMPPKVAATHIGGELLIAPFVLARDDGTGTSTCELDGTYETEVVRPVDK